MLDSVVANASAVDGSSSRRKGDTGGSIGVAGAGVGVAETDGSNGVAEALWSGVRMPFPISNSGLSGGVLSPLAWAS